MHRPPHDPVPSRDTSARDGFDLWSALTEAGLAVRLSMDPFRDPIELRARISR